MLPSGPFDAGIGRVHLSHLPAVDKQLGAAAGDAPPAAIAIHERVTGFASQTADPVHPQQRTAEADSRTRAFLPGAPPFRFGMKLPSGIIDQD